MELFWQVTKKHQQVFTPELTVTFRRVTKEHYVPTEAEIMEAGEPLEEEDYFSETNTKDEITVVVSEGEWMSFELGAIYGQSLGLVEQEASVV